MRNTEHSSIYQEENILIRIAFVTATIVSSDRLSCISVNVVCLRTCNPIPASNSCLGSRTDVCEQLAAIDQETMAMI